MPALLDVDAGAQFVDAVDGKVLINELTELGRIGWTVVRDEEVTA